MNMRYLLLLLLLSGCHVSCYESPATHNPMKHTTQLPGSFGDTDTKCFYGKGGLRS